MVGADKKKCLGQRPSSRLTSLRSAWATVVSRPSRRVLVLGFFSSRWERKARRRRILPVPVILKRLAAPRSVFILGICQLSWLSLVPDSCRPLLIDPLPAGGAVLTGWAERTG